jgi:hypothetical protein
VAVWAAGEDEEENDEQPASAGKTAKDVTIRTSRPRLSRAAPRGSVTRLRNPCVPIGRLYQSLDVDLKSRRALEGIASRVLSPFANDEKTGQLNSAVPATIVRYSER